MTAHTATPWQKNIHEVFAELEGGDLDGYIATIANCGVSYALPDSAMESNAALIVSAVNNTAGIGINPEAVPELLKALESIYNGDVMRSITSEGYTMGDVVQAYQKIAGNALSKARGQS